MTAEGLLASDFAALPDLIRAHAAERPSHPALIEGDETLTYGALAALMDRIAFALQRDGVSSGDAVAICARTSIPYGGAFLGILAAGGAVALLAPSSTATSLMMMLKDSSAKVFLLDRETAEALKETGYEKAVRRVALDESDAGEPFSQWLAPEGAKPAGVSIAPDQPFNIIYSSGTTGAPKGIVQPHRMRWGHFTRVSYRGAVTVVSTPLYSNTTLVVFLPTLAHGGTAVLMPKFDAGQFLRLSEARRATHAMLVPVQYRRIMQRDDFGQYDLSSYVLKLSTSAPFPAALKADVLRRWPGGLVEFYGMTEGGGATALLAHEFPHKLHTVGQPMTGHDIRLIDEMGHEVASGKVGEVVGRSEAMMTGYHNLPEKTREAEWFDAEGRRFVRTGDIGRFDEDGFLILIDRSKDVIISGGFNIYPSDIEAELVRHDAVAEAAVIGAASERWGETPVAFVALRQAAAIDGPRLMDWLNARLGKTQRVAKLTIVDSLPRSAIGKVLKRELRDLYARAPGMPTER
ncbi:MAG TPA: class I adenylate-forming enzyme family protein [Roseiarcus sp.]|nr:class I adenylate-forming enzyme family protein [Roseiarcus sp.]